MRKLAAAGMGLTVLMQLVFFASGFERGALYVLLQLLAAIASAVAMWGLLRTDATGWVAVSAGLGWNALNRALHAFLDLTRLSPWINWGLFVAYALACADAALAPRRPKRIASLRGWCWVLSVLYFLAAVTAVSGGRVFGLLGLTLGLVGMSLVAIGLDEGEGRSA